MPQWQVWLQAFLAALHAFLSVEGTSFHQAAANARAAADEAMLHLHPDVLRGHYINPATTAPILVFAAAADEAAKAAADEAAKESIVLDTPNPIPPVDDDDCGKLS